jgi:hypothetical protein
VTALFFGKSKFRIGALLITDAASRSLTLFDVSNAMNRHTSGDWGNVDAARRRKNKTALTHGGHVLSAFTSRNGESFQILTEWNRSQTTIKLAIEE